MDLDGKHIAVLVDNYFEQAEFEEPISALRDANAEVTVISTGAKKLQGLNHVDKGDTFEADLTLEEASDGDYDALVLPGGAINSDALRTNPAAQNWVSEFLNSGRIVAAICHAPWVFVSADLLQGRRLTSYETIQDDITNAGGEWVDEPVVVDKNLITSRKPDDLPDFNQAIIDKVKSSNTIATAAAVDLPYVGSEQKFENKIRLRSMGYDDQRDELDELDEMQLSADQEDVTPDEFYPNADTPGAAVD